MGNFNRGGSSRFGGDRGGSRFGGSRGGDRGGDRGGFNKEMFKTTCSECSKPCEVPFRPTNGKPVFCRDCFATKAPSSDRGPRPEFNNRFSNERSAPSRFSRPESDNRAPAAAAPAFAGNDKMKDLAVKMDALHTKIDRLALAVEALSHAKNVQTKPQEKIVVKSAPVVIQPKKVEVIAKKEIVKAPAKKVAPAKKKVVARKGK